MGLPVIITTTGSTFSPKVALVPGSTATVTWDCPAASITTTGLTPTLSFGSAASRAVYMTVADANGYEAIDQVDVFNLGFSHSADDPGVYSPSSSYDWTAQDVSSVTGIHYMTSLRLFLASGISSLTGPIDFTGLSRLTNIELYHSGITAVTVAGCVSLARLVLEANQLTTVNINPVAPNLYEFRAAAQQGGSLTFTPPVLFPFGELYHFCVRDQILAGLPPVVTAMPDMQEYWTWNTGQSGTLTLDNPALTDLRVSSNDYTSLTISGTSPSLTHIDAHACSLTTVDLSGAPLSGYIDLSDNALPQAQVDAVLAAADSGGATGGTLLLSGNTAPSGTGSSHAASLTGKSWTVTTGAPAVTVVQTAHGTTSQPLNFASAVTAGNTVILIAGAYTTSGATISSSNPELNSAAVTGTAAVYNPGSGNGLASPFQGSDGVYACAWILPDCPAGNGLTLTLAGGTQTGIIALEVSGLGSSPSLSAYDHQAAASGTPADSGLGYNVATTAAAGLVVGLAQIWDGAAAGPAAPWTSIQAGSSNSNTWAGYRSFSGGSGGAFHWAQAVGSGAANPWCAAEFVINS